MSPTPKISDTKELSVRPVGIEPEPYQVLKLLSTNYRIPMSKLASMALMSLSKDDWKRIVDEIYYDDKDTRIEKIGVILEERRTMVRMVHIHHEETIIKTDKKKAPDQD